MGFTPEEASLLVEDLSSPTSEDSIDLRLGRGGSYNYVEGWRFIEKANRLFGPLWSFKCLDDKQVGGQLVVHGQFSIKVPGRTIIKESPDGTKETTICEGFEVVKEQYGSSEIDFYTSDEPLKTRRGDPVKDSKGQIIYKHRAGDMIDLGDDYKSTATDAMKKCMVESGFFLDMYGSKTRGDTEDKKRAEKGLPTNKQLGDLEELGDEKGLSGEALTKWCEKELGKAMSEAKELELVALLPKLRKLPNTVA